MSEPSQAAAKQVKLVQRLHEKTKSGEIQWERTPNEGVFQVSFSSYAVTIHYRGTGTGARDYYVSIRDENGGVIEEFNDVSLDQAIPDSNVYLLLKDLFEMARRQAMGVEKALDSLLGELG